MVQPRDRKKYDGVTFVIELNKRADAARKRAEGSHGFRRKVEDTTNPKSIEFFKRWQS